MPSPDNREQYFLAVATTVESATTDNVLSLSKSSACEEHPVLHRGGALNETKIRRGRGELSVDLGHGTVEVD